MECKPPFPIHLRAVLLVCKNVHEPSAFAVQPIGRVPATSAQAPRFALPGKKRLVVVSKSLSPMARCRQRNSAPVPNLDEYWYSSSARFIFSSRFRNKLETANATSGAEEAVCTGVPATPFAGAAHGPEIGSVAVEENRLGAASSFGVKNEQLELSNSGGL